MRETAWRTKCVGDSITCAFNLFTVQNGVGDSSPQRREEPNISPFDTEQSTVFFFQSPNPESTLVSASQCLRGKQSLDLLKGDWEWSPKEQQPEMD